MKKTFDFLLTSRTTFILMLLFSIAMGVATFIEQKYDTGTARHFVYNALWFEAIMGLLAINFFGNIGKYKLNTVRRFPILLFHSAFIVMMLGAFVTRYFGMEGNMHIREGESSNIIYSSVPYLRIIAEDKTQSYSSDTPFDVTTVSDGFVVEIPSEELGSIKVTYIGYIENSVERAVEIDEGGESILELVMSDEIQSDRTYLKQGDKFQFSGLTFSYNIESDGGVNISKLDGRLSFRYPMPLIHAETNGNITDTLPGDTLVTLKESGYYKTDKVVFKLVKQYHNAAIKQVKGEPGEKGRDAFLFNVSFQGKNHEIAIFGGPGYYAKYQNEKIDGHAFKFAYGDYPFELPFSLFLKDFKLDRYPGSMSPSSYESEVVLSDERIGLQEDHRIFMNNVLDYGGYRFFQSSYDQDELGTILSVNKDFYGTWISYIAYILLTLGFIFTPFGKDSRFRFLQREIKKIRENRKVGVTAIIVLFSLNMSYGQNSNPAAVSVDHAEKFGRLLVQNQEGRFTPVHSIASDVLHKLSRLDNFSTDEKGKMTSIQVFLDMMLDPGFWTNQKLILVREESVQNILGITGKYASVNDFYDENQQYKLQEFAENAFRKKASERNKLEKEVINVDERVNVSLMVFNGRLLKIFPEVGSKFNQWINWSDKSSFIPIIGMFAVINDNLQLQPLNYNNIFKKYLLTVNESIQSGNYTEADRILDYITNMQQGLTPSELLPSSTKTDVEIHYNKARIFEVLRNVYGGLSLVILLFAFIENLRSKKNKIISGLLKICIVILGFAFLYHTYGLVLRWYLSGHAPWSNGYEALLLVAWAGILAGFCFIKNSKITLGSATLLAFFMLMTAGHSSYDPQLTNLVPVLKSYWLIIHVATLTISYGFFGSGFILAMINMLMYLFKKESNAKRFDLTIKELSYINEMNLTIGLFLATVGTFLGGVWANESWGRYWGWDAKETWALVIVVAYAIILHFRLMPKLKGLFAFNVGAVLSFGTVIMTFVGVNYYLTKGQHSYGAGDTPVFPIWAWILIICIIALFTSAGLKERNFMRKMAKKE